LGVISDHALPEISVFSPNYGITGRELYTKVASYYLREKNMLEILHDCQRPSAMPGLPSWAPDWTTGLLLTPILDYELAVDDPFKASTQRNPSFSLLDSENMLLVDGLYINIIEGLGNQMDLSSNTLPGTDAVTHMEKFYSNWVCVGFGLDESPVNSPSVLVTSQSSTVDVPDSALPYFNAKYVGGGTELEAWRRTILCNKSGRSQPALAELIANTFRAGTSKPLECEWGMQYK
jgi:hypothetical protein